MLDRANSTMEVSRVAALAGRSGSSCSATCARSRSQSAGTKSPPVSVWRDISRDGTGIQAALREAARDLGTTLAGQVKEAVGSRPTCERLTMATCETVAAHGYEPRRSGATITLANCPFNSLARDHPELVCGMNLALLSAVTDGVGDGAMGARLDPRPNRCCVVIDVGCGKASA